MSPKSKSNEAGADQKNTISQNDQMVKIIQAMNIESPEIDFSFIKDEAITSYLEKILVERMNSPSSPKGGIFESLSQKYNKTNPKILLLISEMLQFNPHFRVTAKEALKSPLFNSIRVSALEKPAPYKINIDVDRNKLKSTYQSKSASSRS